MHALASENILQVILSFSPPPALQALKRVSQPFLAAACLLQRQRAVQLLLTAVPRHPAVAHGVENSIFAGCGNRSGPGAYNDKVRQMLGALRGNAEDLVARLSAGALTFRALVRLAPAALQSAASAQAQADIAAAAFARHRIPEPAANFESAAACARCGGHRLWRETFLKAGSWDVTKFHTRYRCVQCSCEVEVSPADAMAPPPARAEKRAREAAPIAAGGGDEARGGGAATARGGDRDTGAADGEEAGGEGVEEGVAAEEEKEEEDEEKEEEEEEEEEAEDQVDPRLYFLPQRVPHNKRCSR